MFTDLQSQVYSAFSSKTPINIIGGQSKHFYTQYRCTSTATPLSTNHHTGLTDYSPTELVITAKAGTSLTLIEQTLAEQGQHLGFEPPHFGQQATWGGCFAAGLSGPARPYLGAVRDFILGITCLNGRGELLRFGGQVMKNVAGYDISRLMVGSLGKFGVLLTISCKVLPQPPETTTLSFEVSSLKEGLDYLEHNQSPLITATACTQERVWIRYSGIRIQNQLRTMRGESLTESNAFWQNLREQKLPFFSQDRPLWRISLPFATPFLELSGSQLIEWGGQLRWLYSDLSPSFIHSTVHKFGGQAILFRATTPPPFPFNSPIPETLQRLQQRLKYQFDPHGILNPDPSS